MHWVCPQTCLWSVYVRRALVFCAVFGHHFKMPNLLHCFSWNLLVPNEILVFIISELIMFKPVTIRVWGCLVTQICLGPSSLSVRVCSRLPCCEGRCIQCKLRYCIYDLYVYGLKPCCLPVLRTKTDALASDWTVFKRAVVCFRNGRNYAEMGIVVAAAHYILVIQLAFSDWSYSLLLSHWPDAAGLPSHGVVPLLPRVPVHLVPAFQHCQPCSAAAYILFLTSKTELGGWTLPLLC